ncbi:hypothetical protein GCM10011581_16950 [Saccharopolyspora subtropica]|uniref:Nuclease SbcCD subunit C n=1 Tax=Saccharopolyspora thermophila TaxID=89367 RepID=A0A917N9C2_9PSEU|nr:hypothetical protein GCM10011581_16950 [Saccharopolyspora subtropica]
MPVTLRFLKLAIETDTGWHERNLDAQVLGIVGPVNTGKSSLLDSCMYCLGRDVPFRKAMRRHVRAIELTALVGDEVVRLRRAQGSRKNLVEVRDQAGTLLQRLPVRATATHPETLSDWLLELLGLRGGFAAVRLGRSASSQLGFDDLLRYLYLPQDSLDQFILFPDGQDDRRRALFELLFGLTNPESEKLQGDIRRVEGQIRSARTKVRRFQEFLADSEATNADALASEVATLTRREADAVARLTRLRADARAADTAGEDLRRQLAAARSAADAAEKRVDEHRAHVRRARRALAAIDHELADQHQATASVERCPACSADLAKRPVEPNHCGLCTQPLAPLEPADAAQHRAARENASQAVAEAEARAEQARTEAEQAQAEVARLRQELDQRSAAALAPFTDAIAQATADLAAIRTRLGMLPRLQEPHERIRAMQDEILVLQDELDELHARREEFDPLVVNKDQLFATLDGEFRKAIGEQKLPWYAGRARLDPNTYLPVVDGQSFRDLGGGVKCAVAVAYSVALMSYAISYGPCDLPMLLVIDSPRKNVGNNVEDRALAHRIYRNFLNQIGARGSITRSFQVILADNEMPEDIADQIEVIDFEYPHEPFIPGIADPHGEDDDEIEQRYDDGEPDG